ncbi:MAG: hypothetical protein AAGA83_08145 [Cyanobacteria bacterium P01_F01_bin.116]
MFSINGPISYDGVWSSQCNGDIGQWLKPLQTLSAFLSMVFNSFKAVWDQGVMIGKLSTRDYYPLEVLPDYYINCDSAKRLWQDWRVLRRLFVRRDHSRDLLLQGQSGWLPIHGMVVHRQMLTITTDEGETVLDLEEPVVWLSRANPANTQITQEEPVWGQGQQRNIMWYPA